MKICLGPSLFFCYFAICVHSSTIRLLVVLGNILRLHDMMTTCVDALYRLAEADGLSWSSSGSARATLVCSDLPT